MPAATADRIPARIAYAALGAGSAPVWTAFEAGVMDRNGLAAEVFMIAGSGNVAQALFDGAADFGNMASPEPIKLSLTGGGELVFLTGGLNYMVQALVSRADLKTPERLKGQLMGGKTDRIFEDLLLGNILSRVGLAPDDLVHAEVGNQPDALARLDRGEIGCALFTPPWLFEAVKRGHNVLLDPFDLMLDFQLGGIVATKKLIAARPDLARRMVKAYVDGVHHYKRHPDDVVKVLEKYSKIADRDTALECHALYDRFFLPKPYPSAKGIQTVLDQMAKTVPEAEGVEAERFIDSSWLAELDVGGYIDELYAREPVAGAHAP